MTWVEDFRVTFWHKDFYGGFIIFNHVFSVAVYAFKELTITPVD